MRQRAYPNNQGGLGQVRAVPPSQRKSIPFDYVFTFNLTGETGNRLQSVVEISMEGHFVATSIGYSLVQDEQRRPRRFQPVIDASTQPQPPVPIPLYPIEGSLDGFIIAGTPGAEVTILNIEDANNGAFERGVFSELQPTDPIALTYRSATAPLSPGTSDRLRLGPDGTVRVTGNVATGRLIRLWDRTHTLLSDIYAVTQPASAVVGPDPVELRLPQANDRVVHVYGDPSDLVRVFVLDSTSGQALAATRVVNDDGDEIEVTDFPLNRNPEVFDGQTGTAAVPLPKALAPGDVVVVRSEDQGIVIGDPVTMYTVPRPMISNLTLASLLAGLEQIGSDLGDGFRLNPQFADLALADLPLDQIADDRLGQLFETGSVAAEEVSFLYSIDVVGTGRELQSQAIHNIAGLGIANGDRPFRPFAKPIVFEPRSSTRIQVEERSGPPGTLFIVLQGYKSLGTARIPEFG